MLYFRDEFVDPEYPDDGVCLSGVCSWNRAGVARGEGLHVRYGDDGWLFQVDFAAVGDRSGQAAAVLARLRALESGHCGAFSRELIGSNEPPSTF